MTVPVPKEFEEQAKKERRSVSNLALIAFDEYLRHIKWAESVAKTKKEK